MNLKLILKFIIQFRGVIQNILILTKKYQDYRENRLFNFASVNVYFKKENKSKIKAQIKRILEKEIKADMVFYENNQTIEKPAYFDYSEKSNNLEKKLEALK